MLGLLVTEIAMIFSGKAQPALLYLVPFILIPVYVQAWFRGEFSMLWEGKIYPVEYALLSASVDEMGCEDDVDHEHRVIL